MARAFDVSNKDHFPKDLKLSITGGHRYGDTRQLLSSFMFLPVARIKRKMLKIPVIELKAIFPCR